MTRKKPYKIDTVKPKDYATTPAAQKGQLAGYTIQDLLNYRNNLGYTNREIANAVNADVSVVINVIGPNPPMTELKKNFMDYCLKQAQQKSITSAEDKNSQQLLSAPVIPIRHAFATVQGRFHVDIDFDTRNIRIKPTEKNWITIKPEDIDDLILSLYTIQEEIKKHEKI